MLVRAEDLTVSFEGEAVLVRAIPRGIGAKVPAVAVSLLAFFATPKSREQAAQAFGPRIAPLVDGLADAGLLVDPAAADDTPVFFGGFGRVDVHRRMIEDEVRVDAYAAAIAATVTPGMRVVDAGTGTGVLGLMAAAKGAQVVGIDNTDVLEIAAEVVRASGASERMQLVRGDFATAEVPEPADLVITETFGALALCEGAARDLQRGTSRWLAPDGAVMPRAIALHFAPIGSAAVYQRAVEVFDERHGVDLRPLRQLATTRGATLSVQPEELAAPGQPVIALRFPADEGGQGDARFAVDGTVYGLVGWFVLDLCEGVSLPTGPSDPHTHWRQVVLPWPSPQALHGELEVRLSVQPDPADRRGLEVECTWRCGDKSGRAVHRVR